VRVPKAKDARKQYHVMRFHTANQVDFKRWGSAEMKRENNYKEFKLLDEDQPKFGAGSEFGREQRDEARRKRFGINVKKYAADRQPWLLSVKDRQAGAPQSEKKFKGIREGGVSDNSAWYVFMQAKDGAFEAYPIDEWYNFQPIQRYNSLNAEEAEEQFEKRDKIMNYFSVMIQKKARQDEEDPEEEKGAKKKTQEKSLKLSEIDDWMSDKDSDEEGEAEDTGRPKAKAKGKKLGKKKGGKKTRTEDGDSGTDCEEESDEYDEGAEHEYESEDSSDSEQENDDKVRKDLAGVEEDDALKKLLDSDDEDETDKKEDEDEADKDKKKEGAGTSDASGDNDSDEEKKAAAAAAPVEKPADALKRKIVENPDGLGPPAKKQAVGAGSAALSAQESATFEQHIRRYLSRKPMSTTEILQKLKSKKTGHTSERLVEIIAAILKKISPQRRKVHGKMILSLKS